MTAPLGMGVVGAGSIGIRGALQHSACRMCRIASRWPPSATPCRDARRRPPTSSASNAPTKVYEDLLADPDVHAVTIWFPDRPAL